MNGTLDVVTIYEVYSLDEDGRGRSGCPSEYFGDVTEAKLRSDAKYGAWGKVELVPAVPHKGSYYLLKTIVPVSLSELDQKEKLIKSAMAKLNDDEKMALFGKK